MKANTWRLAAVLFPLMAGVALRADIRGHDEPYSFVTLAGVLGTSPTNLAGSIDGPGSLARFDFPDGIGVDAKGYIYVADHRNHTIRKVTPTGTVATLSGAPGKIGSQDGQGSEARFNFPTGVAVDSSGYIYVADTGNQTIRKVSPEGFVSTLAGLAGEVGSTDGVGSGARFSGINGVAVDQNYVVYVTENRRIRRISPTGTVTTLAGQPGSYGTTDGTGSAARFQDPGGIGLDHAGNLYIADGSVIRQVTPQGVVITLAGKVAIAGHRDGPGQEALFREPHGIAVDSIGNVYVLERANTIRRITPAGFVTTIAGGSGEFGSVDGRGAEARFQWPQGLAIDQSDNLYITDTGNNTIRKMNSKGLVTTMAGFVGGSASRFKTLSAAVTDKMGNLYVTDAGAVAKVSRSGVIMHAAGQKDSYGFRDGPPDLALFFGPSGLAMDATGILYIADTGNAAIRVLNASGDVSTLAGLGRDTNFQQHVGSVDGLGTAARFRSPTGIDVDRDRTVYLADTGNHTIRRITADGQTTTIAGSAEFLDEFGKPMGGYVNGTGKAARFRSPSGIALDSTGNIYVADTGNHVIRKVSPSGTVSSFAGVVISNSFNLPEPGYRDGVSTEARFNLPAGLILDNIGNVFVADTGNHTIRKITQEGVVTTVAGIAGTFGSSNGTGASVLFHSPSGIAIDAVGSLYVVDSQNLIIRKGFPAFTFLTTPSEFGFKAGQLTLSMQGPAGQSAVLETSTDLVNWYAISTNLFGRSVPEPHSTQHDYLFYRAHSP